MIERYTLPEMGALWTEQSKFQKWLEVEIAVCEVHAEMGTIPSDALEQIKSRAKFSVERINEIEKTTNHDVIAFTTNLAENIGEAVALCSLRPDLFRCRRHCQRAAVARSLRSSCSKRSKRCSKF